MIEDDVLVHHQIANLVQKSDPGNFFVLLHFINYIRKTLQIRTFFFAYKVVGLL